MAVADVTKVFRVPGKLAINPTDLTTAFPHGGTALGVATRVRIERTEPRTMVRAEEFGQEVVEVIRGGVTVVVGCMMRQWDSDVLSTIFPDTSGTTVNGLPATTRAGSLMSADSIKLLYAAENPDNPSILIYKAIPLIQETAELRFGVVNELTIPTLWLALRDASNRTYSIGKIGDLTL